jgi:central kinetochore subunit Mis15/CHL4
LRISLFETPYADTTSTLTPELTTQSKSIFLAFPDGTPFVYISATQAAKGVDSESRSIQSFVINAIPVAISKPQERYELKSTSLTTRSLDALLSMRGAGKGNVAGGGWSVFADDKSNTKALDFTKLPSQNGESGEDKENLGTSKETRKPGPKNANKRTFEHSNPTSHLAPSKQKRLKRVATGRFGVSGCDDDGKDISRFDVRIEDQFSTNAASPLLDDDELPWKPSVKLSFQGSHVFAGIRRLAETGVINAAKMPGWLTGEGNVSVGIVRNGRIDPWDGLKG